MTFPLLETVVSVGTGVAGANAAANAGGGTLTANSTGNIYDDDFQLTVPGAGLDIAMAAGGYYCYAIACGYTGSGFANLEFPERATGALSWTTYGNWATYAWGGTSNFASYVTGFKTPAASVPATGSATYTGATIGRVFYPAEGGFFDTGIQVTQISGDASLQANFDTGVITGSLTNMTFFAGQWNSVSLAGSITNGVNAFSGTAAVSSVPGGAGTLTAGGTGNFVGMFFGPGAQELGAVWNLFDGVSTATGSIGAMTPP